MFMSKHEQEAAPSTLPTHLLPLPPKPGTTKRDSSDGKVPRSSQPAPAKSTQTPARSIQPNVPQTVAASVPAGSTGQASRPTSAPAAAQAPAPAPAIADGVSAGQRDFSGPAHAALKQFFGYDSFVPGQFPVVNSILNGRDVMAAMPAGPDRSLCYQLPATVPHTLTLVIVPSPATVGVEVEHLRRRGIAAALIDGQTDQQQSDVIYAAAANRQISVLYAAPERLLRPDFIDFAKQVRIDMVVVDEAQCVLQENAGFRAEYRNIAGFVHMLPKRPVLAAFADVADPGRCDAIITELGLKDPYRINAGSGQPDTQSRASETASAASQGNSATGDQKKTAAASKPESHKTGAKTGQKTGDADKKKQKRKPYNFTHTQEENDRLIAALNPADRQTIEQTVVELIAQRFASNGRDPAISTIVSTLNGDANAFFGLTKLPQFGMFKDRFSADTVIAVIDDLTKRGDIARDDNRLRLIGERAKNAYAAAGADVDNAMSRSDTEPKASTKTSKKPRPKRASNLTDKEKAAQAARHAETVKRNEELQARVAMIDGVERAAAERAITGLVGELHAAKGEDPAVSSVTFTLAGEAADFIAAAGLTSNPHFGELKGRFDRDLLRGIVMDMTQRGSLVMENRRLRLPGAGRASGPSPSTASQA